jgi:hypothetical protein
VKTKVLPFEYGMPKLLCKVAYVGEKYRFISTFAAKIELRAPVIYRCLIFLSDSILGDVLDQIEEIVTR